MTEKQALIRAAASLRMTAALRPADEEEAKAMDYEAAEALRAMALRTVRQASPDRNFSRPPERENIFEGHVRNRKRHLERAAQMESEAAVLQKRPVPDEKPSQKTKNETS